MAPKKQSARKASTAVDTSAKDMAMFQKVAGDIIDPMIKLDFKVFLKKARHLIGLKDPLLGLDLLQVAVIADNVSAVEQVIALGADIRVLKEQQSMLKWAPEVAPCKLSQLGAESLWMSKMSNFCLMQAATEAVCGSLFELIHLAVLAGSMGAVRFLVEKGHADVNAAATNTGLTPLMCAALCRTGPKRESGLTHDSLAMVELLLQLGGDLGIENCVGNDFVAVAASMAEQKGLWIDILEKPELLAKCSAKHAGRVALQLYAAWQYRPISVILERMPVLWCTAMVKFATAWTTSAGEEGATREFQERFERELSEPITQRILRSEMYTERSLLRNAPLQFWPEADQHTMTNILTAIMQGVAVPPRKLDMDAKGARRMLKHLFSMGVRPKALLQPRRADRGHCRLRCLSGLPALIDVLMEESPDLSPHSEVLMEQLWGHIYTLALHPTLDLTNELDECHIRGLLQVLNEHGVRWWDPANWPQDLIDGKWEQVCPVAFLVANLGNLRSGSSKMLIAICDELKKLGCEDLANACNPSKTPPMIQAAREGQVAAILSMVLCKGDPDRQGSNWAEFFIAATSSYRPLMAGALQYLLNSSLSPHIRESCRRASTDGLTPTFIRYLAGNHAGYEALLLPLLSSAAPRSKLYLGECDQEDILMCAELLFKQCQVALTAPKAAMAEVLQILLDAQPSCNVGIAEAMQMVNKSGVTLLGQAVAWGYAKALPPLLDAVSRHKLDLEPLLDCHHDVSKYHKPLFAAVVYGYDNILEDVLMRFSWDPKGSDHPALFEHVVIESVGGISPRDQSRVFVKQPGPGVESIDLLMCAASVGNSSVVEMLIVPGMDPKKYTHFRKNRFYKSAMHAAVQYPDLAMMMWEGGRSAAEADGIDSLIPGSKQVRCVELLLKQRVPMTVDQFTILVHSLPTLDDPMVAHSAWRLLSEHVSACARCGLLGCFQSCHRCMTTHYCSERCQKKDWPMHKTTCVPLEHTRPGKEASPEARQAFGKLLKKQKEWTLIASPEVREARDAVLSAEMELDAFPSRTNPSFDNAAYQAQLQVVSDLKARYAEIRAAAAANAAAAAVVTPPKPTVP